MDPDHPGIDRAALDARAGVSRREKPPARFPNI